MATVQEGFDFHPLNDYRLCGIDRLIQYFLSNSNHRKYVQAWLVVADENLPRQQRSTNFEMDQIRLEADSMGGEIMDDKASKGEIVASKVCITGCPE